jgi:hypothetical protein
MPSRGFWRGFARQSVENLIEDYLVDFSKDWCASISPETGRYEPTPCETEQPFTCMYDYTKYVALPGRTCDVCGWSNRLAGSAQPGLTAFEGVPLANATAFPFEHLIYNEYNQGTLSLYIGQNKYDYDKAREFYIGKPIVWGVPEAWDYWYNGLVERQGYTTEPNPFSWLDFSFIKHYPYNCGQRYSKRTGLIQPICAFDYTYCNPDARFPAVEMNDEPTIFTQVPADPTTSPICGTSIRPQNYFQRDRFGGLTPGFEQQFTILDKLQDGSIQILTQTLGNNATTNINVFNTGKSAHLYVFEGNFTISGRIEIQCALDNCNGVYMTIWLSSLNPNYNYPSSRTIVYTGPVLTGSSNYSVSVTDLYANATLQSLGWDFNVSSESIITVHSAIVTDADSIAKCTRAQSPHWKEPPPFVVSTVPENRCMYTRADTENFNNARIGACHCSHLYGGPKCDCPAILRNVCNGFGTDGNVLLPSGEVFYGVDSTGCYLPPQSKKKQCKCMDYGKLLFTRLVTASAFDYLKVCLYKSVVLIALPP